MIYVTEFDPVTLQHKSASVNSMFESIEQVINTMAGTGVQPKQQTPRMVLYDGIVFSDYKFIDELETIA